MTLGKGLVFGGIDLQKVEVIGVPGGCWQLKYVWNLSPQTLGEDEAILHFDDHIFQRA